MAQQSPREHLFYGASSNTSINSPETNTNCSPDIPEASYTRSRSSSMISPRQASHRVPPSKHCENFRARKVKFYRNGDQFFGGQMFAIKDNPNVEEYQAFELLLREINSSALCDPSILKQGVRYVFSTDGILITECNQLIDGKAYVCSSTPTFKPLNYENLGVNDWVRSTKVTSPRNSCSVAERSPRRGSLLNLPPRSGEFIPCRTQLIVAIRAGVRPRNIIRKHLCRKTAATFEQVLTLLIKELDIETGVIEYICTIYGRPVTELKDFFRDQQVFIVFGNDECYTDDLKLSDIESKFIDAACGPCSDKIFATDDSPDDHEPVSSQKLSLDDNHHEFLTPPLDKSKSNASQPHANSSETNASLVSASSSCSRRSSPREKSYSPLLTLKMAASQVKANSSDTNASLASASSSYSRETSPRESSSQQVKQKPHEVVKLTHGHAGGDLGIPIPLLNKYRLGPVLFTGDFVKLRKCFDRRENNKKMALKIINKSLLSTEQNRLIEKEIKLMRRFHHCNLIMLIDEINTPAAFYLVLDHFQAGDLFTFIACAEKFSYTEVFASRLVKQVLNAVVYLHSLNVVHRNITLETILVSNVTVGGQKFVKLCDYGLATEVNGFLHDVVGCSLYHSPEMFTERGYGMKTDLWSVGVLTYILLCGFPPFGSLFSLPDMLSVKVAYKKVVFPTPYWDTISDAAKDLVLYMLEADQFVRGTAPDILQHPWIEEPARTANAVDMFESVSNKMKAMMIKSTRFSRPSVGVIAATALDQGMGVIEATGSSESTARTHTKGPSQLRKRQ